MDEPYPLFRFSPWELGGDKTAVRAPREVDPPVSQLSRFLRCAGPGPKRRMAGPFRRLTLVVFGVNHRDSSLLPFSSPDQVFIHYSCRPVALQCNGTYHYGRQQTYTARLVGYR
jgi:hypothetical protein